MAILVIVESPAKANTIKGYLGANYKVIASKGHIRDLPKSTLGIDVQNNFEPHYINIRGKGDVIKEIKKEAKLASKIYLATDPDREGEAISWHIAEQLGIPKDTPCRVTFNEITKNAVKEAIKNPRKINEDLVNSQQARRILDRLVGFKLSEVIWKNLKSGLSGGRVQSVATRIITEREEEIRAFVPQEYWTIEANLATQQGEAMVARLYGDENGKIKITNEADAKAIENKINSGEFCVKTVKHQIKYKQPAPPFTTSTLQQEASKQLGFQSQKIMKVAQELYDGLNLGAESGGVQGLITYMRTDSTRVSEVAEKAASEFIREHYGDEYIPEKRRVYKSNTQSQDAHEAIRPSNVYLTPKSIRKMLTSDQYKLYRLIWERFISSQMESAVLDTLSVEIENSGYIFRSGGYVIKSRGYLTLYDNYTDSEETDNSDIVDVNLAKLPDVKKSERLSPSSVAKQQHFTEPPIRYTEASLIKFLEENGIGRPSTYAPIISIIISREYVKRDGKSLVATPLGDLITEFMRLHFPDIIDYSFTADMEAKLDSIEQKENTTLGVISKFYEKFERDLETAMSSSENKKVQIPLEESDVVCESCGKKMVYKNGRFGKFLACPSYPTCKNTKALDKDGNVVKYEKPKLEKAGFACEVCGSDMVIRTGKFGTFYACENYPTCTFTKQKVTETGVSCPKCSAKVIARHGKGKMVFYNCERYPECDFSSWDMPTKELCPQCGKMLFRKKGKNQLVCHESDCGYFREIDATTQDAETGEI